MLEDDSKVTKIVRKGNDFYQSIAGVPGQTQTMTVLKSSQDTRYFDFQCARYSYMPKSEVFQSTTPEMTTDDAKLRAVTFLCLAASSRSVIPHCSCSLPSLL
jgi:hypothetical protein